MRTRPLFSAGAFALGFFLGPAAAAQTFLTELVPLNTMGVEEFGCSVAISGDRVLVGCNMADDLNGIADCGSAYLYRFNGSTWIPEAVLQPNDPVRNGWFGQAVALQGDLAVVGAPGALQSGQPNGAVYVFEKSGSSWSQTAKLQPSDGLLDGLSEDLFASSVDLFGEVLVVGSPADDCPQESGSAYVFRHTPGGWLEEKKLVGASSALDDRFGSDVAIHGNTVVVGAPGADDGVDESGAVHVFEESGSSWLETAKRKSDAADLYQRVGFSVDLWENTLVAGAPGDRAGGPESGSAFVFERSGGSWAQSDQLLPTCGAPGDNFGSSVSLWNDKLAVGGQGCDEASAGAGAGWLFGRAGATWVELVSLLAPKPVMNMRLGFSAAIEGSLLVIGSPYDTDAQIKVGSAQVWSTDSSPEHAAFCFGVACPCANDDPGAGCANGSGYGALLSAHGSLSLAENDLVLAASNLPQNEFGILVMASAQTSVLFGDGLRCIDAGGPGGSGYRFFGPPRVPGPGGILEVGPGAFQGIPEIVAGSTRYFQVWYRERQGPCGTTCNLSNALAITFTP